MEDKEQARRVLRAWHRVEFFQPYTVPDKEDEDLTPIDISFNELRRCKDTLLPWLHPNTLEQIGLDPSKETKYTLYLGLFDKAVLTKIADSCCDSIESVDLPEEGIEQRLDSEGESCFAKLMLNEQGQPDWMTFSVSTLPWAIGNLLRGSIDRVNMSNFDSSCEALMEAFERVSSAYNIGSAITANSIYSIVEQLYLWAGISPTDLLLNSQDDNLCFRLAFYQRERKQLENKKTETASDSDENIDDSVAVADETKLPILNSFYIRDIEKAINNIHSGTTSKCLLQYLGNPGDRCSDLYTNASLSLIAKKLHPYNTPEGRWPSDPDHNMSLMQQFAVNTLFEDLKDGGLLSVNGPPGTGKTTLLREVIAQNIVERSKVLASLNYAGEGVDKNGFLIESLSGYEMVVASSNNAAVENISRELPQMSSLWKGYADCEYFKPVANQLNAKKYKNRLQPIKDPDQQCWGTISAVMGAKKKRDDFSNRFFFYKHFGDDVPNNREEHSDFLNIWTQFKHVPCVSFESAKKDFLNVLQDFEKTNAHYIQYEKLCSRFKPERYDAEISDLEQAIVTIDKNSNEITKCFEKESVSIKRIAEELEIELMKLERLRLNEPSFFARIFNTNKNKQYKCHLDNTLSDVESLKRNKLAAEKRVDECSNRKRLAENERREAIISRQNLIAEKSEKEAKLNELSSYLKECRVPDSSTPINDAKLQQHAYWQDKQINDERSKIFMSALQLHQAWLYEAKKIKAFRENVFKLSNCMKATEKDLDDRRLWQIIFMFVPVVSTTFASLGRMFSKLDESSIGWLMIDEAGQAVPQAAVGGLLRAKRTIVVGDPLQIEPVFTTPPALVDYVVGSVLGADKERWSPSAWSVQELADRVNPYGCTLKVQEKERWIGIPLWVHRRCINPMFDIANKIAYQNRMIHGNYESNSEVPTKKHPQLFENRWLGVNGDCTHKQYYQQLGEKTVDLLVDVINNGGELKNVYIISPFKAVKNALKRDLRGQNHILSSSNGFNAFVKNNIGTVHTFQGKETDTVILVLGCDRTKQGGAVWASSKPNLLNVAVTRAKKNLFVIGDSSVWAGKPFFEQCFSSLSALPKPLKTT